MKKSKILLTLFLLITLIATISSAAYDDVTMTVVEEPTATINFGTKSTVERSVISKDLKNKEITLQLKLNGNKIEDMAFSGHGCAISQASTSIMIDTLKGKTVEEAKKIIKTFIEMIKRETTDEEELKKLEDAIAFRNVSNMPARVKCALLAWHTIEDMLNKNDSTGTGNINCCH